MGIFPFWKKKVTQPKLKYYWEGMGENHEDPETSHIPIANTVAVCSLAEKAGCSHFAYALALYLQAEHESTYVVTQAPELYHMAPFSYGASEPEDFYPFEHIIYDFGCISNLEFAQLREIKKAREKFMLCLNNERYLHKLAEFIQSQLEFTQSWRFLFNCIPPEQEKKIHDLMEGYAHACLPVFDRANRKMIREILRKAEEGI